MAIARTAMIDDDGSGTTGTVINNAWKQELYNQIDGAAGTGGGAWTEVAFNAANFSTPTGGATWTVTAATYHYTVLNKQVFVSLRIFGTGTTTGAPVRFYVTLPAGLVPNRSGGVGFAYDIAGTAGQGVCLIDASAPALDLLRNMAGTPFPAGTTYMFLQAFYSIL